MDLLYFHDLPRAHEGCYLVTRPPELQDEWSRRTSWFQRDEAPPEPAIRLIGFIVRGPERVDRYGLVVRAEDAPDPDPHADAIRRTMPTGWELAVRTATI